MKSRHDMTCRLGLAPLSPRRQAARRCVPAFLRPCQHGANRPGCLPGTGRQHAESSEPKSKDSEKPPAMPNPNGLPWSPGAQVAPSPRQVVRRSGNRIVGQRNGGGTITVSGITRRRSLCHVIAELNGCTDKAKKDVHVFLGLVG
jgi:hypothetical protein